MKTKQYTTIKVSKETHDILEEMRTKNEHYEDVIKRLIASYTEFLRLKYE